MFQLKMEKLHYFHPQFLSARLSFKNCPDFFPGLIHFPRTFYILHPQGLTESSTSHIYEFYMHQLALTRSNLKWLIPTSMAMSAATSAFSISASVKVRARCSFLGENTSTSAIYVAVTGR